MSRIVQGACPLDCPDTCAWQIEVDDSGKAVSLRGDLEHPFTRGALCGKVNRYLDALYDPERLLYPLRRVGPKGEGQFERIGWDEAIEAGGKGDFDRILDRMKHKRGGPQFSREQLINDVKEIVCESLQASCPRRDRI